MLDKERQDHVLTWINKYLIKSNNKNNRHTSYGLKHIYDACYPEDRYLTNGEFKGAMLKAGFKAYETNNINWCYNIHERSITKAYRLSTIARCRGISIEDAEIYCSEMKEKHNISFRRLYLSC